MENNHQQIGGAASDEGNNLFPIFLKPQHIRILLIGAGPVGLEKLTALVQNSPNASIHIIALDILPEVLELVETFPGVTIEQRAYKSGDIHGYTMVIAAVNNRTLSENICKEARYSGILVNVADTPDLCDFYLGSIVKKGHLKIAISTNGKSPTMAKRIKEMLMESLPNELDQVLDNMRTIRQSIKGDFQEKVKRLNDITALLASKSEQGQQQ